MDTAIYLHSILQKQRSQNMRHCPLAGAKSDVKNLIYM